MRDINFLISKGIDINKSLELFGDISTYNKTVGEFLNGIKEKISKLGKYKDKKDLGNYTTYAKSIMNDAAYFGFKELSDIASTHAAASSSGDLFYITEHYSDIVDEANKCINIIREYLLTDKHPSKVIIPEIVKEETVAYTRPTILVVDDSNIIRNFVKRVFADEYDVVGANDGDEALKIIEANKNSGYIECILLDLNMPKKDGFSVLEYMNEHKLFNKMPVSILTGDTAKKTVQKAFDYQIVDMLNKPFTASDVKRIVEKSLYIKKLNA